MTTAEHILDWAANSQPHWKRLKELRPGSFNTSRDQAYRAFASALLYLAYPNRAGGAK